MPREVIVSFYSRNSDRFGQMLDGLLTAAIGGNVKAASLLIRCIGRAGARSARRRKR